MKDKYIISIASVHEDWVTKEPRSSQCFNMLSLNFSSIEDCKKVLEMAEEVNGAWIIYKGDPWDRNAVEKSPIVEITEKEESKRQNKHDKEQEMKVSEINKRPKSKTFTYGDTKLIIKREEASYDPARSREVRVGATVKIGERNFWPDSYISKDGKILTKKFMSNYMFTDIPETDRSAILNDIRNIINQRNALIR